MKLKSNLKKKKLNLEKHGASDLHSLIELANMKAFKLWSNINVSLGLISLAKGFQKNLGHLLPSSDLFLRRTSPEFLENVTIGYKTYAKRNVSLIRNHHNLVQHSFKLYSEKWTKYDLILKNEFEIKWWKQDENAI